MKTQANEYQTLEDLIRDDIGKPSSLTLSQLQTMTNNFSEDRVIGSGAYGVVYKGVHGDYSVAVKRLKSFHAIDDGPFEREVGCLIRIKHQNIVRFVGYCAETRVEEVILYGVKNCFVESREKLLCFEYLQNGSLRQHLTAEPCGLQWHVCYQIIKGICQGLHYLHERRIMHLDLKPDNILLDDGMVPKIADFGLSRLLCEGKSRTITQTIHGTMGYMAPEYLLGGAITVKSDIYSLGVIIKEMVMGRSTGATTENVLKSWMHRLEHDSKQTRQIKVCIEISESCTELKPEKRPATGVILCWLEKTEAGGDWSVAEATPAVVGRTSTLAKLTEGMQLMAVTSSQQPSTGVEGSKALLPMTLPSALIKGLVNTNLDKVKVAKIGQWGGVGGAFHDVLAVPRCLESLIICSGEVIYSLKFSYIDDRGKHHTASPWGGQGPHKASNHHEIQLGLLPDHLLEVSGTIGPFDNAPAGVITSLTFITNAYSYGPFGEVRGTPFHIAVQNPGSIVGFYASAGWYVDSFGVYVNPKAETMNVEEEETAGLAKIGPWGGNGGNPRDIRVKPRHLDSVTIHSGLVVNSLEFSYSGQDGQKHTMGPWGSPSRGACTIELGPLDFLTGVYGTTGLLENVPSDVVTSLTLVTKSNTYGPFGQGGGTPFQIAMQDNGSIHGFFGRAGLYVNAIGVYAKPQHEAGLTKIGPWGGTGGTAHYIDEKVEPKLDRLEGMTIRYGIVIDSLEFSYVDNSGKQHTVGPWGGSGGSIYPIRLETSDFIQGVSGTYGPFGTSPNVITSLTFATNNCLAYGPFGQGGGTPFSIRAGRDGRIVGFFAYAGSYLEAIGAYVQKHLLQ